jgi:ketosteroid isomerase-like protein
MLNARWISPLVLAAWMTAGCASTPKIDLAAETGRIKTVADQFPEGVFEREDMELLAQAMAHDAAMVCFGTDVAEHFVGWDSLRTSIEQQLEAFDSTRITVRDQVISLNSSGNTAWVSELLDWDGRAQGQPVHIESARFTGVLEKRNDDWVFVQFHVSVPVAGQAAAY